MREYRIKEIEEQHLACQVRNILKAKKLSEVEIEAWRWKVTTPQEPVEGLIENDPADGSDVTPVIEIGVEQNHPGVDGGMEGTDELHQNGDTHRIRRMMQKNSSDPIPSLQVIDVLKVWWYYLQYCVRVENLNLTSWKLDPEKTEQ